MWNLIRICALVLAPTTLPVAPDSAAAPTKVFLFAGQSNMVGADSHASEIDDYPLFTGVGEPQRDVRFSYFVGGSVLDGWTPLAPVDESFGPELTFARTLSDETFGPFVVIKCAVGGTTAAHDWNPDAPENGRKLFPRAIDHIRSALEVLRKKGEKLELEAMFWHQGENDMLNADLVGEYAKNLERIIAAFREELDAPQLPWFMGEISDKGIWGMDHRRNMQLLREQQLSVVKDDTLVHWVPTSHLAFEVMSSGQPHYHFGTQGQLQHGVAYAEAFLDTVAREPKDITDAAYDDTFPVKAGDTVRVFVVAGQRNMEGEDAHVSQLSGRHKKLARPRGSVLFRSVVGGRPLRADWTPLAPAGALGNFGPELSLGAALDETIDEPIAILKLTDSAALISDWDPSEEGASRPLYARALATIKASLDDLARRGCKPRIEAIFWHHGENETWYGPFRARYADTLEQVIARLRKDLARPQLDWFIARQSKKAPWGAENIADMNARLRAIADADFFVHTFETSDLPHQRIHFGTEGTVELGERFAEIYAKTIKARK